MAKAVWFGALLVLSFSACVKKSDRQENQSESDTNFWWMKKEKKDPNQERAAAWLMNNAASEFLMGDCGLSQANMNMIENQETEVKIFSAGMMLVMPKIKSMLEECAKKHGLLDEAAQGKAFNADKRIPRGVRRKPSDSAATSAGGGKAPTSDPGTAQISKGSPDPSKQNPNHELKYGLFHTGNCSSAPGDFQKLVKSYANKAECDERARSNNAKHGDFTWPPPSAWFCAEFKNVADPMEWSHCR